IEGVADHATLGALAGRLTDVHGDGGGTRREDRVRRGRLVHRGEELDLEVGSFRGVFLDEVGFGERPAHVRRELQPLTGCAGREASPGEYGPGVIDVLVEVRFRVRRRIGGDHVEPAGHVVGGPAGTDYPRADDGDAANWFVE